MQSGVGAEIAALAQEFAFDYLDAPVERISSADVPAPYAKSIEDLMIPQAHNIEVAESLLFLLRSYPRRP